MTPPAPTEVGERTATDGLDALEDVAGLPLGPDGATTSPDTAGPTSRGRLRRLWFVPAGVALLGAAALVPSVGGSGPGAGEARVLVDGIAVVTDPEGGRRTITDDRVDVGPGDRVEVTEGRAVFEMAGDVRLEGLGRHDGRDGTTVEMAVAPRLVTGRLLAVAPEPLEIAAGDTTVSIEPAGSTDGAARLDRRLGLGVGTYRGHVAVDTAGEQADVARYRRVEVAGPGALGADGLPLRYAADDTWDRRFLGEALEIDGQIAPLLASLSEADRETFLDPSVLRAAMPGLPGGGLADRLDEVDDGGAALVLAAIATVVDERSFTTAWDRAAEFQGDGAPWGLTSLDQGVRAADVLPALRSALDTLDLDAPTATDAAAEGSAADDETVPTTEGGATAPAAAGGADGTTPTDPNAGGENDPSGGGGGGGTGGPGVTTPGGPSTPGVPSMPVTPPTVPPLPSVPEVVGGVGGVVGGTVDGVTDGVDVVLPGVGGAVDDVVGGVGDVVDGVGGVVGGLGTVVGPVLGPVVGAVGRTVGALGTGLSAAVRPPAAG